MPRKLLWSDEFAGLAGSREDQGTWTRETGAHWVNGQLQCYTDSTHNAALDGNGNLVISAFRSPGADCSDRATVDYTSARLRSRMDTAPRTIEVRAKIPNGVGVWPAIWTLGSDYYKVGWPNCGEVDLAEVTGREPGLAKMSLHGPGYSGVRAPETTVQVPEMDFRFHVYGASVTTDAVVFTLDGKEVWGYSRVDLPPNKPWVFGGKNLMVVINVAVGGGFAGPPSTSTSWPQRMVVDWVRAYA